MAGKSNRKRDEPPRRSASESVLYALRAAHAADRLRALTLCSIAGVMVFVSFPTYDFFYLQWISLVPLMWVIEGRRPWPSFFWGFWTGLVTNWGGFYWVTGMLMDFGHFSLPIAIPLCGLLCAYQGLVFAIWAGLTRWLQDRTGASLLVLAPMVWVVVEYCLPFIFPWYFANGQYLFYPAIQVVELVGVLGLSALIVAVNTGLYLSLRALTDGRRRDVARPLVIAVVLFSVNVVYGVVRIRQVDALSGEAPTLRIGVGEANVGIFEKEARHLTNVSQRLWMLRGNILKHHLLSKKLAEEEQVDLVVLPESSFIPVPVAGVRFKRTDLFALVGGVGRHVWEARDQEWTGPQRTAEGVSGINAIAAGREDAIFAVGPRGLVLRREGEGWVREEVPTEADLHAVWVGERSQSDFRHDQAPFVVFAVGEGGTALRRGVDGAWRALETGTVAALRGVSGNAADRVFAVGEGGTVIEWNGRAWSRVKVDTTATLHDVWAALGGRVVAVGDRGTVLERVARQWRKSRLGEHDLLAVDGEGDRLLVVGERGSIFEAQGSELRRVDSPTRADLLDVAIDGRDEAYAVGEGGVLLVQRRGQGWAEAPRLRDAGALRAVAGIPYTEAHAFGRDSRFIYPSPAPLPDIKGDLVEAVADIGNWLPADMKTPAEQWNTPIRGFDVPVLMGLLTYEPKDPSVDPLSGRDARRTYNSAMLVEPDGRVVGRYDKNFLLIFGEYIPFGDTFPQFYEWLPEASHFYPGDTVETFPFKGFQLGVMICYEDIIPRFTRSLAGKDPNVLINVTNDAWFGKTSEPYLHLALATFRAVENRLWLIRSTNTGVSAFVDAVGRIVAGTDLDHPEVLARDVPMLNTATLYRSYGDLFAYACMVVFGVLAVQAFRRRPVRRRKKRRGPK